MNKTIINVNSMADFTVVSGRVVPATYLIQNDIDVNADLHFSAGCELIFQGGKLNGSFAISRADNATELSAGDANPVELPTSILLTGDQTVI